MAVMFSPDKEYFQPTPKVDVVDTIVEPVILYCRFITSILKGKSIQEAHKIAVDVSAFVCTQGAMPKLIESLIQ